MTLGVNQPRFPKQAIVLSNGFEIPLNSNSLLNGNPIPKDYTILEYLSLNNVDLINKTECLIQTGNQVYQFLSSDVVCIIDVATP